MSVQITTQEIIQKVNIISYTICKISVLQYISVTMEIILKADDDKLYNRIVSLIGPDYTAWGIDDTYLSNYITNHIVELFFS